MTNQQTIAEHLIASLKSRGVKHAFGVPGDYVLDFMDRVIESGIIFVGNCNELNAGYAADGYARANGMGVAIVTYGVGGFSILNAIAGAFAEQAPLVVISGAPHTRQKRSNALVHHLAGGYEIQSEILRKVTVDSAVLDDPRTAANDIRRVLDNCVVQRKPVYFEIPVDSVDMACDQPEKARAAPPRRGSDPDALSESAGEAAEMLNAARSPVVIVGVEVQRFQLDELALGLVESVELPYASTISSKSVLPELHPQFIGLYQGSFSREPVRNQIENSDCVLSLGVMMNDFNTGMFSSKLDANKLINARAECVWIKHHCYRDVQLADFLKALKPLVEPRSFIGSHPAAHILPRRDYRPAKGTKITVRRLFERINNLLNDEMILVCDTGDAICAAADLYIEEADNFISQAYYLSIGYSLPATLGVALARTGKRIINVIGDGAFQMTAQELSTIARNKCNPVIFVLNNKGYVIERMIHDGIYNDIQNWNYHKLPEAFGAGAKGFQAFTEDDLENAISSALADKDHCSLISVELEPTDCSDVLAELGRKVRSMSK